MKRRRQRRQQLWQKLPQHPVIQRILLVNSLYGVFYNLVVFAMFLAASTAPAPREPVPPAITAYASMTPLAVIHHAAATMR